MNIENHIIFNIIIVFIIKNSNNILNLSNLDWYILLISSIFSCLLPDIDHPNSTIGSKFIILSNFIYKFFGHREITHSLLFLIIIYNIISKYLNKIFKYFNNPICYGFLIGYLSHILLDMSTEYGISLFWPIKKKIKIKVINIYLLILIILILKFIINYLK